MKNLLLIFIIVITVLTLYLKFNNNFNSRKIVYFYVTSSIYNYIKDVVVQYNKENNDGVNLNVITGSSGELIYKLDVTRKCDLMILASEYFAKLAENKKLVKSKKKFIQQVPVIIFSNAYNYTTIDIEDIFFNGYYSIAVGDLSFTGIGRKFSIIKANLERQYGKKIKVKNNIMLTNTVAQTISYLKSGIIDIGIVFENVALANNMKYVVFSKIYNETDMAYLIIPKCIKYNREVDNFIKFLYEKFNI